MSNEMIDRVAKAIYEVDGGKGWHLHSKFYLDSARAAIEAMREPTEAMKFSGGMWCEALMFEEDGEGIIFDDIGKVYEVMIDAALAEGESA